MATRTVDLGTVGFGLQADTSTLAASLRTLKAFGQQVDLLAAHGKQADPLYKKFQQIERTLSNLHGQVQRTTQRMRESGVAATEIDKITQAYHRLARTVTHSATNMDPHTLARGVGGMRSMIATGNRLAGGAEASKMALAFRDLERAAILAVGPLSGLGARLAVLSALFESAGAKMTLFIAAATGLVAVFAGVAIGSVRASMDMERFDAQLQAATGSATLTAREFNYVRELSDKLGQNVRTLVEPYAKFATAARLSNVAISDQRKIFEGAITAGTAMKLSNERMGLVFLALEQMISKGTVSMEELRRQLGDLLPGSMALAARAMGVTEQKLIQMIENGEVMAKDLLPKLAEQWQNAFGPAAAAAAQTLQSELNRLGTASFEFLKAFDQATRTSAAFRTIVVASREALTFLSENIYGVINAFIAFGGAIAGFMLTFVNWSRLTTGLVASLTALRTAIVALDLAAASTVVGRLGTTFLRLGGAIAGATGAYLLMRQEQTPLLELNKTWLEQMDKQLDLYSKIGLASKSTTEQMIVDTADRMVALHTEMAGLQAQMTLRTAHMIAMRETKNRPGSSQAGTVKPYNPDEDPEIQRMREQERVAAEQLDKMNVNMKRLRDMLERTANPPASPNEGGKQFQTWAAGIQQAIREFQSLGSQIEAFETKGKDAALAAEGVGKAIEKMADMPKKAGDLKPLQDQLRAAGFEGKNLTEQLKALYAAIEQSKNKLQGIEGATTKMRTAGVALREMFDQMQARRDAIGVDPEKLRNQEQLNKHLETMRDHMTALNLDQAQQNALIEAYKVLWGEVASGETDAKHMRDLRRDIENLNEQLGDGSTRAVKKHQANVKLIEEAMEKFVISGQVGHRMFEESQNDLYRKMLDRTSLFGRSMQEMFRDLERGISRTLAQMVMGQKASFRDLFNAILQQLLEFSIQVSLVQPILKAAFGGAYTRNKADEGTGFFEGFLMNMANRFGASSPNASVDGSMASGPYGGMDSGAMFNMTYFGQNASGGQFTVPGSGPVDSELVAFHATPGERVSIAPVGMGGGGGAPVHITINNTTGMPIEAETRGDPDLGQVVVDLFFSHLRKDGRARNNLNSMLSKPRH